MAAGEKGEIVLRGPKVFKGYWRDPAATATAFAGGWFHTGDIGVRDADGYVYIVDRPFTTSAPPRASSPRCAPK